MTPRISRRAFFVSLVLFVLAIVTYVAFAAFSFDYVESKAALLFIESHRALGESDKFILDIVGQGLPQPWEIIVMWQPFQIGTLVAGILILGLGGLTLDSWNNQITQRT